MHTTMSAARRDVDAGASRLWVGTLNPRVDEAVVSVANSFRPGPGAAEHCIAVIREGAGSSAE
jgi:hypothetical protein